MQPAAHTATAGAVHFFILVKVENFFICKNSNILLDRNIDMSLYRPHMCGRVDARAEQPKNCTVPVINSQSQLNPLRMSPCTEYDVTIILSEEGAGEAWQEEGASLPGVFLPYVFCSLCVCVCVCVCTCIHRERVFCSTGWLTAQSTFLWSASQQRIVSKAPPYEGQHASCCSAVAHLWRAFLPVYLLGHLSPSWVLLAGHVLWTTFPLSLAQDLSDTQKPFSEGLIDPVLKTLDSSGSRQHLLAPFNEYKK